MKPGTPGKWKSSFEKQYDGNDVDSVLSGLSKSNKNKWKYFALVSKIACEILQSLVYRVRASEISKIWMNLFTSILLLSKSNQSIRHYYFIGGCHFFVFLSPLCVSWSFSQVLSCHLAKNLCNFRLQRLHKIFFCNDYS